MYRLSRRPSSIRLKPPGDPVVQPIGAAGGTVTSLSNTSVVFATGAMTSTGAVRLTDLPVDEFTKEFSSLPGPFTDGKIPLGFVAFEPEGVTFSAPVTWTIEYTGSLPVGSQLACWIEAEARWGNPVPSVVVNLGNGKRRVCRPSCHTSASTGTDATTISPRHRHHRPILNPIRRTIPISPTTAVRLVHRSI